MLWYQIRCEYWTRSLSHIKVTLHIVLSNLSRQLLCFSNHLHLMKYLRSEIHLSAWLRQHNFHIRLLRGCFISLHCCTVRYLSSRRQRCVCSSMQIHAHCFSIWSIESIHAEFFRLFYDNFSLKIQYYLRRFAKRNPNISYLI